jgi:hypothetical protein
VDNGRSRDSLVHQQTVQPGSLFNARPSSFRCFSASNLAYLCGEVQPEGRAEQKAGQGVMQARTPQHAFDNTPLFQSAILASPSRIRGICWLVPRRTQAGHWHSLLNGFLQLARSSTLVIRSIPIVALQSVDGLDVKSAPSPDYPLPCSTLARTAILSLSTRFPVQTLVQHRLSRIPSHLHPTNVLRSPPRLRTIVVASVGGEHTLHPHTHYTRL